MHGCAFGNIGIVYNLDIKGFMHHLHFSNFLILNLEKKYISQNVECKYNDTCSLFSY